MKAVLWGKKNGAALTSDTDNTEAVEQLLGVIKSAPCDVLLRAMQQCDTANSAREKLQLRFAHRGLIKQLGVPNSLQNMMLRREEGVGNYTA